MKVRPVRESDRDEWLRMRIRLWPSGADDHPAEIDDLLDGPQEAQVTLVAERDDGLLCGFLEAGTRDGAEGCASSPVGFIEGWWVDADQRRRGIGSGLLAAAEDWARRLGLTEMASDTDIRNERSQWAHKAAGYEEVERVVCFRKLL